ncbi:NhaA family Na+:H+ antiporter [Dongia mobilis]|uniref:Na(+)/H(+) antiporter NhaA n=1 Tax=Dongia mobilis TaxID=578943 RepID=A0A4V3DEP6_9PROT|nr:Na+/H+ antiporter NhaA [Dongia mobilis]TDQ81521.1 NhaA family Na+:H+ antiporter [Dongia mobilis]
MTLSLLKSLPKDAIPGVVLVGCAIVALVIANSPLGPSYEYLLKTKGVVAFGAGSIEMPLAYWIKNALMAIFFFFAGMELKRELLEGQLADLRAAALPIAGALGGMAVPAAIYLGIAGTGEFVAGWAIPSATDIAFALGVLSLLGSRVPAPLKAFLLAVAVVDDLGAILIVAFVYTSGLQVEWLGWAAGWLALLVVLNRFKVRSLGAYALLAVPLWVSMQNSGVNPTIAGVLAAAVIPLRDKEGGSPLHDAEHLLRPWVLYGVMPVFAVSAAGVSFAAGIVDVLVHPVALGAGLGLALGKPVGITLATMLAAMLLRTRPPGNVMQLVGLGLIAGIGFTMSLFIGALAFSDPALAAPVRVGVYGGSIAAAVLGLIILSMSLKRPGRAGKGRDETHPFIGPEPEYEKAKAPKFK